MFSLLVVQIGVYIQMKNGIQIGDLMVGERLGLGNGGAIHGRAFVHGTSAYANMSAFKVHLSELLRGRSKSLQKLETHHISVSQSSGRMFGYEPQFKAQSVRCLGMSLLIRRKCGKESIPNP